MTKRRRPSALDAVGQNLQKTIDLLESQEAIRRTHRYHNRMVSVLAAVCVVLLIAVFQMITSSAQMTTKQMIEQLAQTAASTEPAPRSSYVHTKAKLTRAIGSPSSDRQSSTVKVQAQAWVSATRTGLYLATPIPGSQASSETVQIPIPALESLDENRIELAAKLNGSGSTLVADRVDQTSAELSGKSGSAPDALLQQLISPLGNPMLSPELQAELIRGIARIPGVVMLEPTKFRNNEKLVRFAFRDHGLKTTVAFSKQTGQLVRSRTVVAARASSPFRNVKVGTVVFDYELLATGTTVRRGQSH